MIFGLFIKSCRDIQILVKIEQNLQQVYMNSYVRLQYLTVFVFITETGCILCWERSEAEETVDSVNTTVDRVRLYISTCKIYRLWLMVNLAKTRKNFKLRIEYFKFPFLPDNLKFRDQNRASTPDVLRCADISCHWGLFDRASSS